METRNSVMVAARVSLNEKTKVRLLVANGDYINEADFVRTAIREKLRKEGE